MSTNTLQQKMGQDRMDHMHTPLRTSHPFPRWVEGNFEFDKRDGYWDSPLFLAFGQGSSSIGMDIGILLYF